MSEQAENPEHHEKKQAAKPKRGALFVIALFVVGIILLSRQEAVNTINCDASIIDSKPDVIMLGAWWCSYCYKAKKYFQKNNIHYCEYDMESTLEGKRLYEKHGAGAIPILLIGKYQLNGFSERQIEAALAAKNEQPD